MDFKNSKLVKKAYGVLFYFELGKNNLARLYQFIPDVIIILGGVKYLLNVDLKPVHVLTSVLVIFLLFTFLGYFINKTGLYAIDKYVQANKDPVQSELLESARLVKKELSHS